MPENVAEVVMSGLCIGCGACRVVCSSNAIKMSIDPRTGVQNPLVGNECTGCGSCVQVCFGAKMDFSPSGGVVESILSGSETHGGCYSGFAANEDIRHSGSSGGIVTALLGFLIEENLIDGAIVVRNVPGHLGLAESFLARSSDDLLSSATSKYCPVRFDKALSQLRDGETYALVGLPCHVFAVNKLIEKGAIRGSIVYRIGLLCGGTPGRDGTRYVLESRGISTSEVIELMYRGAGWPGRMLVKKEDSVITVPYLDYWPQISPWFTLERCITCLSGFNTGADVSVGDLWLPDVMRDDRIGTSLIITRSPVGENLVSSAQKKGFVNTERIDTKYILQSQRFLIEGMQRKLVSGRESHRQPLLNYQSQNISTDGISTTSVTYRQEVVLRIGRFLASSRKRWRFLRLYVALLDTLNAVRDSRHI